MRITSPCDGGAVHHARRCTDERGDVSWDGFCPCCKRPLSISFVDSAPCEEPRRKKRHLERYAYVCVIWGQDPQHILGAMVLGYSLRRTGTSHAMVILHTDDVPAGALALLRRAGWHLSVVDNVDASEMLFSNPKNRFARVFLKLRVFALVEYSKVLLMDSDLLVRENIDDLFQLPAPAAMHRGVACGYQHGERLDGRAFFGGARPGFDYHSEYWSSPTSQDLLVRGPWSWGQGTGINAGVMLLRPSLDTLNQCLTEVTDGSHPEHIRGSGPEQDYLSRFFASDWSHMSVAYNFQLHQAYFMLRGLTESEECTADRVEFCRRPDLIKIFHYSGDPKPWARRLDARYAALGDEEWLEEVRRTWSGYREFVCKDPEYITDEQREVEVPAWAIEAIDGVMRLAFRLWDEAYQSLATELSTPDLGSAVRLATALDPAPSTSGVWVGKLNRTWDLRWSELPPAQREAAEALGWSVTTWEPMVWMLPHVVWSDLPPQTQSRLEVLGESAQSWDKWAPEVRAP